jgi:uncharacterized membrane protein HdeD (DUF308 family)
MDTAAAVLAQAEIAESNLVVFGVVSVLAGILILVVPRVLNYIVAVYLIVVGVLWIVAGL